MAFAPQTFEECAVMCPESEQYINCFDNVYYYTSPIMQASEFEVPVYPTIVYALYPAVDMKDQDVNSLPQQISPPSFESCPNEWEEEGEKVGVFFTSSPEIKTDGNTFNARNSLSNLDESLTISDCTPPEQSEEQNASLLSFTFNNSFDLGVETPKLSNDSGYYDANGCWYPSKTRSLESSKSLGKDKSSELTRSPSDSDKSADIIPPSKLLMPKQLMSYYNYYQRLDLPLATLGRPHLVRTFTCNGNISVEDLWQAHMKLLFRNFPHKWSLSAAHSSRLFDKSWSSFKDMAKVRFYCQNCLDGWTSMFGVVIFFYSWSSSLSRGLIRYQVSGQKCGKCNPNIFEMPLWYPEEAQKVITNLYYEIASKFYDLRTPQHIRTRRLGQPINQHNKSLCQGCIHGLCKPDEKFQGSDYSPEHFSPPIYSPPLHSVQGSSPGTSVGQSLSIDAAYGCSPHSFPPPPHFSVTSTSPSAVSPPTYSSAVPYFDPSLCPYSLVDMDSSFPNCVPEVPNFIPPMAVYYPYNY